MTQETCALIPHGIITKLEYLMKNNRFIGIIESLMSTIAAAPSSFLKTSFYQTICILKQKAIVTVPKISLISKKVFCHYPDYLQEGILHARFVAGSVALFSVTNIAFSPIFYFVPEIKDITNVAYLGLFFAASGYSRNAGVDLDIETTVQDGMIRVGAMWLSAYAISFLAMANLNINTTDNLIYSNLIQLIWGPIGAIMASAIPRYIEKDLPRKIERVINIIECPKQIQDKRNELAQRHHDLLRVRAPRQTRFL